MMKRSGSSRSGALDDDAGRSSNSQKNSSKGLLQPNRSMMRSKSGSVKLISKKSSNKLRDGRKNVEEDYDSSDSYVRLLPHLE